MQEFSQPHDSHAAKKQRISLPDPDVELVVLMRRHLASLDNALRSCWICHCLKCSGLNVRLSLPQHERNLAAEARFDVFFVLRAGMADVLQEAQITVK
jgi:hypothetical protein